MGERILLRTNLSCTRVHRFVYQKKCRQLRYFIYTYIHIHMRGPPFSYTTLAPVYMRFSHKYIYSCTFRHVYTHCSYSSVRPPWVQCAKTRMYVYMYVCANRRFTQTRSIVLRGMRTEACKMYRCVRLYLYVCTVWYSRSPPKLYACRPLGVHRRHWTAGEGAQFSPFV